MAGIKEDPYYNAIQDGIKEDIEVAFSNKRYRATVILIYSGMDAMAYLDMPSGQDDVKSQDFIRWADRFIRFPCKEQLTGNDLYGARCAFLHTYGIESKMSRRGVCRQIGYADQVMPEVQFKPHISTSLVIVSISGLKKTFFSGIDEFLVNALADKVKAPLVTERMQKFVQYFSLQRIEKIKAESGN